MFGVVTGVLFIGVLLLFLYIAPNIANTIINDANISMVKYENQIKKFENIYHDDFRYISNKEYNKYKDNNLSTEKIKIMHKISKDNPEGLILDISKFIIKFKVDDKKIEFILKILPYVIGVVLAGFLFTYRLHIVVAKELNMKKIDIISKLEEQEKSQEKFFSDTLLADLSKKLLNENNANKTLDDE